MVHRITRSIHTYYEPYPDCGVISSLWASVGYETLSPDDRWYHNVAIFAMREVPTPRTDHRSLTCWSTYFRRDMYDLLLAAQVTRWEPYDLSDLAHVSWFGSVLDISRSSTTPHDGRYGMYCRLSRSASVRGVELSISTTNVKANCRRSSVSTTTRCSTMSRRACKFPRIHRRWRPPIGFGTSMFFFLRLESTFHCQHFVSWFCCSGACNRTCLMAIQAHTFRQLLRSRLDS